MPAAGRRGQIWRSCAASVTGATTANSKARIGVARLVFQLSQGRRLRACPAAGAGPLVLVQCLQRFHETIIDPSLCPVGATHASPHRPRPHTIPGAPRRQLL